MGIKSYDGFFSLSKVSLWSLWEMRLLGEVIQLWSFCSVLGCAVQHGACLCSCIHVWYACGGQKSSMGIILQITIHFFETGFLTGLEVANWAMLPGQ